MNINPALIGTLIPIVALLMPIAIVWINAHYKAKERQHRSLGSEDTERLQALSQQAESLRERVQTLEKILDADVPDWRDHHGPR